MGVTSSLLEIGPRAGLNTIVWWSFEASEDSHTTYGDMMKRRQYVAMSLEGVILKNEFCELSTCHVSLSQTRCLFSNRWIGVQPFSFSFWQPHQLDCSSLADSMMTGETREPSDGPRFDKQTTTSARPRRRYTAAINSAASTRLPSPSFFSR